MTEAQEAPTRLRLIRQAQGLTQAKLGRLAGVAQAHISLIERGYATRGRALARLAAVLGEARPERLLERAWFLERERERKEACR